MADQNSKSSGSGLTKKLLMPVVATAVSAAATYAGKKAPQLLEKRVMPKLRDAGSGTEDLVAGLTERAKSAVPGLGSDEGSGTKTSRRTLSSTEFERRRSERAEHRSERRKGQRSSAS
jgi:hypothetical protein